MGEETPRDTEGREATGERTYQRNYYLGLINGTLATLGNRILSPQLVLAAFVYEVTGSKFLVGLLTSLAMAGHRLPQLYVGSLIEHRERKKRFYVAASVGRAVLLAGVAGAMLLSTGPLRMPAFMMFFLFYFAFRVGQGSASIPFMDILAGTIGPSRVGGFFGKRHFLGSVVALICSFFLVQPVLDGFEPPLNYAVLTLTALALMVVGWTAFALVDEVRNPAPPQRRSLRESLAAGIRMLMKDPNYRGLLWLRVLSQFNGLAFAFCVPYGVEKLGAVGLSGIFLGFVQASRLVSSLVWGYVSDRRGNRLCLLFAALFFTLSPAAALVAPRVPELFRWPMPFTEVSLDLPLAVYLLALCMFGFAQQANMVGLTGFTVEAAPRGRRPSYIAFLNTAPFPLTFLPAVAGALARGSYGLTAVFAVVVASGIATLAVTLRLREVRHNSGPAS